MLKQFTIGLCCLLFSIASSAQKKKVLFVMSAAKELPLKKGKTYTNTGVFLSEFYLAYKDIDSLGYIVDFATPNGVVASIDKESYDPKYWKGKTLFIEEAKRFVKENSSFNHPMTLQQVLAQSNDYAGLVVPGGQGLMVDLVRDSSMQALLTWFGENKRSVGLICHAPALLITLPAFNNPFKGYRVNSVTGIEELFIEKFVMKGKPMNRKIGKQLKQAGYKYKVAGPAKNYAVKDRLLVTSQNPFSNQAFSKLFLQALLEQ